jgi:hypothetical protein
MSLPGLFKIHAAYKPTAEIETFLGDTGELFYSSDQRIIVISDGATAGGNLLNTLRVQDYTEGDFANIRFTSTLAFDSSNFALETQPDGTIKISVIGIDDDGVGAGSNINVLGSFNSVNQLPQIATVGDSYLISNELHVWTGSAFENVGPVRGPQGYTGSRGFVGSRGDTGFTGSQGDLGYTGSIGYTGSQGLIGYTGSIGDTGFVGSKGFTGSQGDIGYTGSIGFTGSRGDTGFVGSQGELGYTGSQGEIGYTGSRGDTGYVGSQGELGYTGSIGYTGSQGDTGFAGSQGDTGYVGSQGEIGYTGSIGFTGSQGNTGYVGSQGDIGYTGSQGEIGYTGSQGDTGFVGSQGEQGYTGSQGDIGYTGSQGDVGFVGSRGDLGYTGSIGYTGSQGNAGYVGSRGELGYTGSIGFTGSQGEQGYTGSQGFGITSAAIVDNELVITYEDDSTQNLGRVVGYDGSGSGSIDGFTSNSLDTITLNEGYSIVPETDDLQDLGSPTNRFRDVYVGPGSLHLGNTVISSDEEDDLQVKNAAGNYKNVRANNLVLGSTTTLPTNPTTGIVFANGTVQTTSAPRFYSDGFVYFDELGNSRITAGDYLYDYVNGTLFVTSFIPFNGWVVNRGTGYQPNSEFAILDDVPLTGGSGSGAEATVIVLFGEIFEVLLTEQGTGYTLGDSLSIDLNDSGSGFEVIVNNVDVNTGAISNGYLQLFDLTVY